VIVFTIEIQRHNDQNESGFEKFNLNKSLELSNPSYRNERSISILDKDMHEAHDALICIGKKNVRQRQNSRINAIVMNTI
jgi:DNA polymerase-3 subunit alpha